MSDQQALIEAIRSHPDEDTPRLMLADWYEENGDSERGEFIRVQCELARTDPATDRYPELHVRQLQMLAEYECDWLGEWSDNLVRWEFRRGMLEEITVEPEPYCRSGEKIFRAHPVCRVAFVNDQGESLEPFAIRDVIAQPHTGFIREINAAACEPEEQACGMFGGEIHTNAWLSELACTATIHQLQALSLYGATRGGRENIDLRVWEGFCGAEHLRSLRHLDLSNCYDYHGNSAVWEPLFQTLVGACFATEMRSLQFASCYTGPEALTHLVRSGRFTQLQSLTLGGPVAGTSIASGLSGILDPGGFPELRTVAVPYGRHLIDLANHPGWGRFKSICLFGTDDHQDRTRATHEPILRAFFRSPHIHPTTLVLAGPTYADPEEIGLWEEVAGAAWFGNLQELAISFYNRNCAPLLERTVDRFPQVRSLALTPNTTMVAQLATWPGLSNLVELALNDSHNATDPDATAKLFSSPHFSPRLSRLRASGICRSARAVEALAKCPELRGLTHLDFAFNELSPTSAEALASSANLKHLRSLHTWSEWHEDEATCTEAWMQLTSPDALPSLRDVVIGSGGIGELQVALRHRFGARLRIFSDY